MLADLDSGTIRHLTTDPGIDKGLALATATYRQSLGSYSQPEEVWRIGGITRKCDQTPRSHASHTAGEKSLLVGTQVPRYPCRQRALSRSMMNFVCKGQAISSPSRPSSPLAAASGPHRVGRRHTAIKQTALRPQAQQASSSPQELGSQYPKQQPTARSSIQKRKGSLMRSPSQLLISGAGLPPFNAEGIRRSIDVRPAPGGLTQLPPEPSGEPTVVLKTSSKGKNVNFPRNIRNKRALTPSSAIAFHCDRAHSATSTEAQRQGPVSAANATGLQLPDEQDLVLGSGFDIKMSELLTSKVGRMKRLNLSPQNDDMVSYAPASRSDHETLVRVTPFQRRTFPNNRTQSNRASDTSSSRLSRENLLLYEKINIPNKEERRQYIEVWISDVNNARSIERHLNNREQLRIFSSDRKPLARVPITRKAGKVHTTIGATSNVVSPERSHPRSLNNLKKTITSTKMGPTMPQTGHQVPRPPAVAKLKAVTMRRGGSKTRKVLPEEKEGGTDRTRKCHRSTMPKASKTAFTHPTSSGAQPRCRLQTYSYRHSASLANSTPTVASSFKQDSFSSLEMYAPKKTEGPQRRPERMEAWKPEGEDAGESMEQVSERRSCRPRSDKHSEGHQSKKVIMETQHKQRGTTLPGQTAKRSVRSRGHSMQSSSARKGARHAQTTLAAGRRATQSSHL